MRGKNSPRENKEILKMVFPVLNDGPSQFSSMGMGGRSVVMGDSACGLDVAVSVGSVGRVSTLNSARKF